MPKKPKKKPPAKVRNTIAQTLIKLAGLFQRYEPAESLVRVSPRGFVGANNTTQVFDAGVWVNLSIRLSEVPLTESVDRMWVPVDPSINKNSLQKHGRCKKVLVFNTNPQYPREARLICEEHETVLISFLEVDRD